MDFLLPDGEPMLAQQTAGQISEFAQNKSQGFASSGSHFNGLHEHRSHLTAENNAEFFWVESQYLGEEPPINIRPVAHAGARFSSGAESDFWGRGIKVSSAGISIIRITQPHSAKVLQNANQL